VQALRGPRLSMDVERDDDCQATHSRSASARDVVMLHGVHKGYRHSGRDEVVLEASRVGPMQGDGVAVARAARTV
jgi:hypothetical protein